MLLLQVWQAYSNFNRRTFPQLLGADPGLCLQFPFDRVRIFGYWHHMQWTLSLFQLEGPKIALSEQCNFTEPPTRGWPIANFDQWRWHDARITSPRGIEEEPSMESHPLDSLRLLHCLHWYDVICPIGLPLQAYQLEEWPWWQVPCCLWKLVWGAWMHKSDTW